MSRKSARENTYKLVFEYLFLNQPNAVTYDLITHSADLTEDDKNYIDTVYKGVIYEYEDLMATIDKYAVKYSVERMVRSDIAALLIAIYELKFMDNIPDSVSINEAVDLVKKYSTEKSSGFVNGILSSVYKEINAQS